MKTKKSLYFIIFFLFLLVCIPLSSLAKYLYTKVYEHYLTSKDFYFESDLLSFQGSSYSLNNYGGLGVFNIKFNIKNYLNLDTYSKNDISYDIMFECSSNVSCSEEDSSEHVLLGNQLSKDDINILITPISVLENDDITLNIKAKSTSLYSKVLTANITYHITNYGINYIIEDNENDLYLKLHLVNLTNDDKEATIAFNNSLLSIDTSNELVYKGISTIENDYVSKSRITITANDDKDIYFYKKDITQNYSLQKDIIKVE